MAKEEDIVFEISGNAHLRCYEALCRAVEIAGNQFPAPLSIQELSEAIVPMLKEKKSAQSVARALARAAEDAWENGGRAVLEEKYNFRVKPSPKELIFKLAQAMERPTEYRVLKGSCPQSYGIIAGKRDEEHWMAVAPFLKDEEQAAAIVHVLNTVRMPMEEFREMALSSTLTKLIGENPEK